MARGASDGSSLALGARTYVRYVVPLTIAALIVLAPIAYAGLRVRPPANALHAKALLQLAWIIAGTAWTFQLLLVGAAAPLARAIADGAPVSQPRALGLAIGGVIRAFVPCLGAIAAVAIGGLALVLPGVALLVLLSLTAASTARGMPAPLVDSAAIVRDRFWSVAAIVVAMVVFDVLLAVGAWKLLAWPLAKKVKPAQLAGYRDVVQVLAVGLLVASPIFAALLAGVAARARRPDQPA
ncbi:MAG: hypothetical protein H0T89_30365 [Deltaproteobacteria bacterium]|nr:hypothetical protein [Deltaproteobacteria bacterium]